MCATPPTRRISGRERLLFGEVLDADARNAAYEALLARLKDGADTFVTVSEAAHLYAKLSWYLSKRDRDAEARQVGRIVLDSGATNAFVPFLHALSCIYLERWAEAHRNITQALNDPDAAANALDRAAKLAPKQNKFLNRKRRYRKKAKKKMARASGG